MNEIEQLPYSFPVDIEAFQLIYDEIKKFVLVHDDTAFCVGDRIKFCSWDGKTSREEICRITYIEEFEYFSEIRALGFEKEHRLSIELKF